MNLELLRSLIKNSDIEVISLSTPHQKASELYVEVSFKDAENQFIWTGLVPYFYRRAGLFIENEEVLAIYLAQISPYFRKTIIEDWITQEKLIWESDWKGKEVTKGFFDAMISMDWTSAFPPNDNPQRRIQDIKELGYTIASRRVGKKMERLLLPIPRGLQTGYETFSKEFRIKSLKVLNHLNAYEMSTANKAGLLPDHKFPEIRWDAETKTENPETMSEKEIQDKFQLLDNQRNQQKREVCRNCFQSGKRGVIFGIKYYYEGNENWNKDIPKIGKNAEKGCVGCAWYDIAAWRKSLNKIINQVEE
jgi:ICEA Protein